MAKVSQQAWAAHGAGGSVWWGAELQRAVAPSKIRLHLCTQALQNSHRSLFRHKRLRVLAAGSPNAFKEWGGTSL